MRQLSMNLPWAEARGREDFMVSSSNAKAMALVGGWPDWPQGRLALIGPAGSGKSHLAAIWAEETEARTIAANALTPEAAPELAEGPLVIEDADRGVDEDALFHLWNACAGERRGLLMTGRAPPADWKVALPDLASRLSSLTPARIGDPDDALLSIVLLKLFADRQLVVKPALIGYLMGRMERSYVAARAMVDRLDAESLARGRPINQALAREILEG
ncbi:chromosomal replication initiator DnaA [uncultured Jannaschia sp.]|uniref:chromosomal replication initiator DnaA n=1 Tax=uncultured Jannaschia sp. TaxID=293347 RepID=UPI0034138DB8